MCLGELSGRAQRAEKTCAHDTSQPQYMMEERGRACTPAALTMIPRSLPRSLPPSPSSGSHQDSDDLMMRETTLIIHTQQTSPLAVLLSHTGIHEPQIYTHRHTHSIPVGQTAFTANFVIIYFACTQYGLIILGVPARLDNHKPFKVLENIINHLLYRTCVNGNLHDGV